jgi:tetratricopeptide (TPR) repeat protein
MNLKTIAFLFIITFFAQNLWAQPDGYWDKDRATSKEIIVGAGNRIVVKTEDFPVGTTEVVYRITLLDQNQQLANNLVSILKAIPDPTGISQGSAGAVFLVSKVSGEDKCKYAVFSSSALATSYQTDGKMDKACWFQNNPVSKDAKLLSLDNTLCLKQATTAMWFGFESNNWLMNQKIVLEVVPWVDNKASRGWTADNKKAIINLTKTSDLVKRMINSDDFCVCILEKFQAAYRYPEFQKLLAVEKSKTFRDFGNACLTEKPANKPILDNIRADANNYFKKKKYTEAIELLKIGVIDNGNATALDYNGLATYYLFSKQYEKAIKALTEGEKLDSSELLIQLNLAHAYLLHDEFRKAKELHKKYKLQNVTAQQSWIDKTQSDFEAFRKANIQNEDFDRILNILKD